MNAKATPKATGKKGVDIVIAVGRPGAQRPMPAEKAPAKAATRRATKLPPMAGLVPPYRPLATPKAPAARKGGRR